MELSTLSSLELGETLISKEKQYPNQHKAREMQLPRREKKKEPKKKKTITYLRRSGITGDDIEALKPNCFKSLSGHQAY